MRQTTRAARGAVFYLAALVAAGCGGNADGGAGGVTQGKNQLLLLDELAQPVAQTRVLIDGKVVTTDVDGRAELGDLPASYDAVVVFGTEVSAFLGLEARSPKIVVDRRHLVEDEYQARVDISRATIEGPNQALYFSAGVAGANVPPQSMGYNGDDDSTWADVAWAGASDATLSAQAFLADVDPNTKSVLGYSGFATKTWPNAARQRSVAWTPEFETPPFETKTIHVELSVPGDVSGWFSVSLRQPSGETGPVGDFSLSPSADLLVPNLPGATFDIFAALFGKGGSYQVVMRAASAGTTVYADGGEGVQQFAPAEGVQNVTPETDFSWSAQPGHVHELLAFSDSTKGPGISYHVVTSAGTARLPDASALGLPFPKGLALQWLARSERGHASLDEYAAAPGDITGTGFSDYRSFTTAP